MRRKRIALITTGIVLILCIVSYVFNKPKTVLVISEYDTRYLNSYPSVCFVGFEGRKYLIKDVVIYEHGVLTEHQLSGSEGLAIEKIELIGNCCGNNREYPKILYCTKNEQQVIINSVKYKITESKADTIVCKLSINKIMLFVAHNN